MPLSDSIPARHLFLPPKGRPYWLPGTSSAFELQYLSWGYRWFGKSPIEPSRHEGWHYFAILEGSPLLTFGRNVVQGRAGAAHISHPDCPVGHSDTSNRRSRILAWIWQSEPSHAALRPKPGSFLPLVLNRNLARRTQALHAECRKAVGLANERGMLELKAARLRLDLCLLDATEDRGTADDEFRFNLGVEYLRNHLSDLEPVRGLSEYLQVSEASVKRLFHKYAGKSPRKFFLDWRMLAAKERLTTEGASVKEVAYALGYRHPNDFSRAFKRHHGFEASRLLAVRRSANARAQAGQPPAKGNL